MKNLSYSRFWAARHDKQPGPFSSNLILDGENVPLAKMIAATERGVLVTRLWYIRMVDPQQALHTGLTRDGTFWIEDGKIKHPIKNFRFNESPVRLLSEVEQLGTPQPVGRRLSLSSAASAGQSPQAILSPTRKGASHSPRNPRPAKTNPRNQSALRAVANPWLCS